MVCERCGASCRNVVCWKCVQKEKTAQRVLVKCRDCGKDTETSARKQKAHEDKGGIVCGECRRAVSSSVMTETLSRMTIEQRSANGKLGGGPSHRSPNSETVKKQWASIRSDPEAYESLISRRAERMREVWANRSEEERNRIVSSWLNTPGKRSKGSEELKQAMIGAGLYDGFSSEVMIHGFCVDEVNEDLKLVVEYFGDGYHCNPVKYKDPDQFLPHLNRTVGEQWKRDRIKIAALKRYGYDVIVIWERGWKNRPQEQIGQIRQRMSQLRGGENEILPIDTQI